MQRLTVDGRFFRLGDERVFLRLVTYGPFPGGWPDDFDADFRRMADAGFQALRLYDWPSRELLDAAAAHGLQVFAGHLWPSARDFLGGKDHTIEGARLALMERAPGHAGHPAMAGVFVANEVPSDLVRWMGATRVLEALETLIADGRGIAPGLLWAYANYPSTEYLEPANADFTAMNVYLENGEDFSRYLTRLQHVAGDRPVMISEFGFDSRRGGLAEQAETLAWGVRRAREGGAAGLAIYAWSDRWWNAGAEVTDWDFGLTDRQARDKPALGAVRTAFAESPGIPASPSFSVIVCCRDGRDRIGACLRSLESLRGPAAEIIVVDDGSGDGTADFVEREFPDVRLIRLEAAGLSAARNAGAGAATGEVVAFTDDDCEADPDWLVELARVFGEGWDAVGGPNLPPAPRDLAGAVVTAAPGAASHVMLDDREAEHVPGCNIAVRRSAYFQVGGFDPAFRTAGDDVDFCWRLRDAGMRIGFAPNAFVWHHRRTSPTGYLRQQIGYGRAERLLRNKHPDRFSPSGDAMWRGVIYSGAPVRAEGEPIIYHGPMGLAGYQGLVTRMQPLRPLDSRFDSFRGRWLLRIVTWLAPRLRSRARTGRFRGPVPRPSTSLEAPDHEFSRDSRQPREAVLRRLLEAGWQPAGPTDGWDLEKNGSRLLLAREVFEKGEGRLLVRIWGREVPELDS
ncbi:glycosyltransferase [Haloferula sp. A504]|uniref:glycosyltransferase n=1 Tax=Haloferula sp. A504 TaxID=3373601 RepID=UPI0031BF41AA|nr:glycosyltransferase [Verrucomicrobiaceae bacterium E54]